MEKETLISVLSPEVRRQKLAPDEPPPGFPGPPDTFRFEPSSANLAKRLDTFDIIDLKVCEITMESMEIDRNQLPPFIESDPYAPD